MEVRSLVAGDARILGRNGEMFEQILQRGPGLRGVASEPFPGEFTCQRRGAPILIRGAEHHEQQRRIIPLDGRTVRWCAQTLMAEA